MRWKQNCYQNRHLDKSGDKIRVMYDANVGKMERRTKSRLGLIVLFCYLGIVNLHDEDTPFNRQLLDDNDGATLGMFGDLCKINWHLG